MCWGSLGVCWGPPHVASATSRMLSTELGLCRGPAGVLDTPSGNPSRPPTKAKSSVEGVPGFVEGMLGAPACSQQSPAQALNNPRPVSVLGLVHGTPGSSTSPNSPQLARTRAQVVCSGRAGAWCGYVGDTCWGPQDASKTTRHAFNKAQRLC